MMCMEASRLKDGGVMCTGLVKDDAFSILKRRPEAKLAGAICVCSCAGGACWPPNRLGCPKGFVGAAFCCCCGCPKPPNAGALPAAPNAGVLEAKLKADELAPNAGVLDAKPKAEELAAAKAGAEAPAKLKAELLAGAVPKAGAEKLPKRDGALAAAGAEAPAKLKAGAEAAAG